MVVGTAFPLIYLSTSPRFFIKGRLADELRNEQDHGMAANKAAKALQSQSMELQARLDEVEENAIRHGKKVLAKLEERVRNLEDELGKQCDGLMNNMEIIGNGWRFKK